MTLTFDANGRYVPFRERAAAAKSAEPKFASAQTEAASPAATAALSIPIEFDIHPTYRSRVRGYTRWGDPSAITVFLGNLNHDDVTWTEQLNMDIVDYTVRELSYIVDHELIHAVGTVRHNPCYPQRVFDKVVALMGNDLRFRERMLSRTRDSCKRLERMVCDLPSGMIEP